MPRHDVTCQSCKKSTKDHFLQQWPKEGPFCECGGLLEIDWTSEHHKMAQVDPRERSVVWEHPGTGEIRYPGRNDVPMPERYRSAGFERREFASLHDLERFEKQRGVLNEKAWYDNGSGRGIGDESG